jgi:hypothetical protein
LIDADRNAAVEFVQQQASEDRKHGGLVTCHRPASFTGGRELRYPLRITEERQYSPVAKRDGEGLLTGAIDVRAEDASVFRGWLDGVRGHIGVYADEETCSWLPDGYRPRPFCRTSSHNPTGQQKSRCQMVGNASR